MPYARNGDVLVHFEDFEGPQAAPVVALVFGIGMPLQEWVDFGYVERLRDSFRVVAIEPRGHGRSSCPREPDAYELGHMASDIRTVLDGLEIPRVIVWGYSLGAKIALAFASSAPDRIEGMVLGGFEPHSEVDPSNDVVAATLARGGAAWRDLWQQMFDVPPATADRLARADTRALRALRQAEGGWETLADAPRRITAPCLLYAGEHCFFRDAVRDMAGRFADARLVERNGANHFELMPDSGWICAHVRALFSA
ncbi:MAG TPA: alpha/beta fold hydrolase [Alphaproteobacteria bacterium]|nr:alpha/beta fold hydrolase [Alphaproteobacteria bacterium]